MIAQMEYLRKQLLQISNDIRKMMREQRYNTNYYLLRSIPGIGPLTAASILVEIGDVKRFADFYHLNSFVGLLPMEHSSGQKENKLEQEVSEKEVRFFAGQSSRGNNEVSFSLTLNSQLSAPRS